MTKSTFRVFKYSLGSLAFGSVIIAFIDIIRIGIYVFRSSFAKVKRMQQARSRKTCSDKCLSTMNRTIQMTNSNAYIEIAIYGHSFYGSARKAFLLLSRNRAR